MLKLSFIVPVYNVEPYLRKCIDSLLAQDYENYEIILVDDGSTDNSCVICDEYASHSPIIRVIHQDNAGLSAARNAGIKVANGEYICFVDSDDYWNPNVLSGLMAQIERDNLDVLRFNYQNVNEQYEIFQPNKDPKRDVDFSETVTDGETFLNERLGPACYAVMFIIRRDLILNLKLEIIVPQGKETLNHKSEIDDCLFTEGVYFEDTEWTPRMLLRAMRVASTMNIVYNYLWRAGSITLPTDQIKRKKVLDDKIALLRGFKEQSRMVKDPKWFTWMTSFTTMTVLGMLTKLNMSERNTYLSELKELNIFPLSTYRANRSSQWKIRIANCSPSLYCMLMSLRK